MHDLTLAELRAALDDKSFSATELTQHFLQRIQQFDSELNSFISVTEKTALTQAANADKKIQAGTSQALTGIPIALKDIFCTQGIKTSAGSKMLDNFIAPYNATVTEKLANAGAVLLGKTNMDEFAMGSSNENSFYGPVKNPWDTRRIPGGSSGGSAAAVSAGLAPATLGTDTGGSIRQPAALCGITGLKPTYGRVSRYGMIAFASSLDQAGPMTRTAEDAALLLNAIAGHDRKDSTSHPSAGEDYTAQLHQPLNGLTIGLPTEYFAHALSGEMGNVIEAAMNELKQCGVTFKSVSLPHTDYATSAYYVIAPAECSSNLARFDGVRYGYRCDNPHNLEDLYTRSRSEAFGAEVQRRILVGTHVLSSGYYDAYYLQAQKIRRLIRDDFLQAFNEVDLILAPTTPSTAFQFGEKVQDPVKMYLSDIFTIAVNLAGLPAISVPAGFSEGLPVGLQLIGNHFQESRILNAAHQFQCQTDWHRQTPEGF